MSRITKFAALPAVYLAMAPISVVSAAPSEGCFEILREVNNLTANVTREANIYWTHRENFVELKHGPPRRNGAEASQLADQERTKADPIRTAMPNTMARLHNFLQLARQRNCLAPSELLAIRESAANRARSVSFDQFPEEDDKSVRDTPRRMPN